MIQPAPPRPPAPSAFFQDGADSQARAMARRGRTQRVLACLDESVSGRSVAKHALAMGRSLALPITLARIMDVPHWPGMPTDPVEWRLRRGRDQAQLERLATSDGHAGEVESIVLSGEPRLELSRWIREQNASLVVLGTQDFTGGASEGVGAALQMLLVDASLLLVPPLRPHQEDLEYRRLLVPLDGSVRAESVLPIAVRIARSHRAELILAHVVPRLEIVGSALLEPGTRELRDQLEHRNEEQARFYLDGLRRRMSADGLPVRTIVARSGDARAQLRRLIEEQSIDLIVLSSHGTSSLAGTPCGSVTEYLATHPPAPILVLRPDFTVGFAVAEAGHTVMAEASTH